MRKCLFAILIVAFLAVGLTSVLAEEEMVVVGETALRIFPQEKADIVRKLRPGDRVLSLQSSGEFILCEFKSDGQSYKGWVHSDQLAKKGSELPGVSSSGGDRHLKASDPSRSFWFPTALHQPRGMASAKGYYFLGWDFDYTLTDTTTIGLRTAVPIGFVGLGPYLRQSVDFSPDFHVGVLAGAGFIASLFKVRKASNMAYVYGAGGMVTAGNPKTGLTVGTYILGGGNSRGYGHLLSLNTSAYYRVTQKVKAMLEGMIPMATDERSLAGKWAVLQYGIRYCGESMSGDIGFIVPIYDDMGRLMRYVPLGFPAISLNIVW